MELMTQDSLRGNGLVSKKSEYSAGRNLA